MAQITGGRVVYKRTMQPAPFESISAEVEFAFLLEEGETPANGAADAMETARTEVMEALRLKRTTKDK